MNELQAFGKKTFFTLFISSFALCPNTQAAEIPAISTNTIANGNLVYPPSYAFVDLLQRSAYISKPETQQYLQNSHALVFHAMSPYYIVQRNETSCSLASATMILNTVRDVQSHERLAKPATQNEVLEMVNNPLWDATTSDDGPGVTLTQFGCFLKEMFLAYKVKGVTVETIFVENKSLKTRQMIHQDLLDLANETHVTTLLALNFDNATFINANIDMGHISPVGRYDPLTKLVLILDVDREWTGPYWITEETMIKGLKTFDKTEGLSEPTYRGYIRIRINE
jgi:hypothetical protein